MIMDIVEDKSTLDDMGPLLTLGLYSSDRVIKFFSESIEMTVNNLNRELDKHPDTYKRVDSRVIGCYARKNTGIYESEFYNAGVDINTIRKKVNKYLHSLKLQGKIKGYRLLLGRDWEDSFWKMHEITGKPLDYSEKIRCCHYVDHPDKDYSDVMTIGDYFTHSVYISCKYEIGV